MAKTPITNVHPEFTLLITGSANNDLAAEKAAASGVYIVHHKLAYVAPYEKYDELRKLQLKVRHSPCAVGKKICAAIDISDWIDHEEEDYFVASVKYFHDHTDRMNFMFTVGECDMARVQKMYVKLRTYMRGAMSVDETFMKVEALAAHIGERTNDTDAAVLLAQVLMEDAMKPLRTYPAVKSICLDIEDMNAKGIITLEDVKAYLSSENSLIHLMNKELALKYSKSTDERKTELTGSHSAA